MILGQEYLQLQPEILSEVLRYGAPLFKRSARRIWKKLRVGSALFSIEYVPHDLRHEVEIEEALRDALKEVLGSKTLKGETKSINGVEFYYELHLTIREYPNPLIDDPWLLAISMNYEDAIFGLLDELNLVEQLSLHLKPKSRTQLSRAAMATLNICKRFREILELHGIAFLGYDYPLLYLTVENEWVKILSQVEKLALRVERETGMNPLRRFSDRAAIIRITDYVAKLLDKLELEVG